MTSDRNNSSQDSPFFEDISPKADKNFRTAAPYQESGDNEAHFKGTTVGKVTSNINGQSLFTGNPLNVKDKSYLTQFEGKSNTETTKSDSSLNLPKKQKQKQMEEMEEIERIQQFRPNPQLIYPKSVKNIIKIQGKSGENNIISTAMLLIYPDEQPLRLKSSDHPRSSFGSQMNIRDLMSVIHAYLVHRSESTDVIRNVKSVQGEWTIAFDIDCGEGLQTPKMEVRFYESGLNEFKTIMECVRVKGDTLASDAFFQQLDLFATENDYCEAANKYKTLSIGVRETGLKVLTIEDFENSGDDFSEEDMEALDEEFKDLKLDFEVQYF